MIKYFFHNPSWGLYAMEFYGNNESEARANARAWLKVDRLPNNTSVWRG